jgi:hypothetical protein
MACFSSPETRGVDVAEIGGIQMWRLRNRRSRRWANDRKSRPQFKSAKQILDNGAFVAQFPI